MDCSQKYQFDYLSSGCRMRQVRHWACMLLLSGTILPISAALGQHPANPSYFPAVSEAYFWGDRNEVYPDPYRAPEKFTPAPGESHPVPRQEVRTRARAERREQIRNRYFSTVPRETETDAQKEYQTANSDFKYPDPNLLDSFPQALPQSPLTSQDLETPAPSHWNQEGGTTALPHPDETSSRPKSGTSPVSAGRGRGSAFSAAPIPYTLDGATETNGQMPRTSILQDASKENPFPKERSILKKVRTPEENAVPQATSKAAEKASLDDLELPLFPELEEMDLSLEIPSKRPPRPGKKYSPAPHAAARSGIILEDVPQEVNDDILLLEASESEILSLEEVPAASDAPPGNRRENPVPQTRRTGTPMPGNQDVPSQTAPSSHSRERSILETTRTFHDSAVQPAAFWDSPAGSAESSSKKSMRYPTTQKNISKKKDTEKGISGKSASPFSSRNSNVQFQSAPQTRSSMPLASGYTSGNYVSPRNSAHQTAVSSQTSSAAQTAQPILTEPLHGKGDISPSRSSSRPAYPTSKTAVQNRDLHPASPKQTAQVSNAQTVSAPSATPTAASRTMETSAANSMTISAVNDSQQEVATYTPVFSSRNSPMQKLTVAVTARQVFQDFSEQRLINNGQIHWSTKYIRALNINEEHLFNALRVLGSTKLSQSRCRFSLMEAAIIASRPTTAADANRLLHIYDNIEFHLLQRTQLVDQRKDLTLHEQELLKAEIILDFMHQNITHEYRLEGTTMTNLLEHGRFNCVTGSILYCSLAEKAGLNVTAVELPGHAMCWVYLSNGEKLEVETTCASWFRYRNDPETQRKVICKLIRDASPQLKDQTDQMLLHQVPQPISDKRLIAKIYYNRGVDLLGINDYAGALEANAIAHCLDQESKTTFGNLLATMNNWAIVLCNQKQFEQAAELLRTGLTYEPTYPPFQNNHTHVYHYWVEHLYRQGDIREALAVADTAGKEQPSQKGHFTLLQKQIRGKSITAEDEEIAAKEDGTSIQ